MTIACPECKDRSKFCTDSYKPFCGIIQNEIDRRHFELFCKPYGSYKQCTYYKDKYR